MSASNSSAGVEKLDPNFATIDPEQGTQWFDIASLHIEGRPFPDSLRPYQRLPARAQNLVPEGVWGLGACSAGMSVRFATDATTLSVRWSVASEALAMPHMAAVGVSGLDAYHEDGNRWHFLGSVRPREYPQNEAVLLQSMTPRTRLCRAYLPLYNELLKAELGIPAGASLARVAPLPGKPIVFYGTSIVQGGCASRPGMSHVNILGRRLHRATINLGFSGNGRAEPELAHLLGEIDAAVYVIDTLGNMNSDMVRERMVPFVHILRAARPQTPIILADHFIYPSEHEVQWKVDLQRDFTASLTETITRLEAAGIGGLHRLPAIAPEARDTDDTVDGTHPTDLGFVHMADEHEPLLRRLLA